MTDREMLDHFSDVLISDPRLLSLQERELLSNLLQRTLHINGDNGIAETIARAVEKQSPGECMRLLELASCSGLRRGWLQHLTEQDSLHVRLAPVRLVNLQVP